MKSTNPFFQAARRPLTFHEMSFIRIAPPACRTSRRHGVAGPRRAPRQGLYHGARPPPRAYPARPLLCRRFEPWPAGAGSAPGLRVSNPPARFDALVPGAERDRVWGAQDAERASLTNRLRLLLRGGRRVAHRFAHDLG